MDSVLVAHGPIGSDTIVGGSLHEDPERVLADVVVTNGIPVRALAKPDPNPEATRAVPASGVPGDLVAGRREEVNAEICVV